MSAADGYCYEHRQYNCKICLDNLVELGIQADKDEIASLKAEIAALRRQLESERLPEGWYIVERENGSIIIHNAKIGGCVVREEPETAREIPESILWALAKDMLAAAPQPKKEGE